jgi:cysteine desulfurase/selenocysteine lyase
MEHHSNIVPWQLACERQGATMKAIPLKEDGTLALERMEELLTEKVKILAVTWVSNSLGTINPIREIVAKAHEHNIPVMVDAAQSIQHLPVDVRDLDIDFLAFSGHKIYGPTGIGVLYGKEKFLDKMPPYQGGGSMIDRVTIEKTTYTTLPFKFEAGTPDISGAIGLGAALNFVTGFVGLNNVIHHEHKLMEYAIERLKEMDELKIIGNAQPKAGAISFLVKDIHPFDLGELLDKQGIAVRTGHHCCQPIMDFYKIPGTVRASFAVYNTQEEIDALVKGIERAVIMLQ